MYNQQQQYQGSSPQYNETNYQQNFDGGYKQPVMTYTMQDPTQLPAQSVVPPNVPQVSFPSQNISIDGMLQNNKPTAPTLLYTQDMNTFGLPVRGVAIETDFHIGTMFGELKITFTNNTAQRINGTFAFPGDCTVTSVDIKVGNNRYVATTYVSSENAQKQLAGGKHRKSGVADDPNDRYIPGVFRCPVNRIGPGEDVAVTLTFMQSVEYLEQRYQYRMPLKFGPGILPSGVPLAQVIFIKAKINCLTNGIRYGSASHNMILEGHDGSITNLVAAPFPQSEGSENFHFAYTVETNNVTSVTIVSPPEENSYDQRSSFVTFVNPPQESKSIAMRDIIFLIDRSGSMAGPPWSNAATAIGAGLNTLRNGDRFGIVCFDHEASFFGGSSNIGQPNVPPQFALYNWSEHFAYVATQFVMNNPARGGTNIKTPLIWAIDTLAMNKEENRIPFVVLITDGAVRDEKEIVAEVKAKSSDVRVLTFGIGQHCNWYFLKMLAAQTGGWASGALDVDNLTKKMQAMISRASMPILIHPQVKFERPVNVEMTPMKIPDLFVGGPLVIAGRIPKGQSIGDMVTLQARTTQGKVLEQSMKVMYMQPGRGVPLSKLFVKRQLDEMIARHWLNEDNKLKQEIVEISVNENLPTPHTTMVAYEMDQKQKDKLEKETKKKSKKTKKSGPSAGTIAKYAGGAVALTAGAVLAGSIAMTMQGGSGFGAVGDIGLDIGGAFGGGCCDCCGEIFGGICGECCGDIFGGIGDVFGDVCGCCGDVFGEIGGVLTDCSCCGELVGGLGDCCGEIIGCLADCPIEEICSGCIDILSGILDAL